MTKKPFTIYVEKSKETEGEYEISATGNDILIAGIYIDKERGIETGQRSLAVIEKFEFDKSTKKDYDKFIKHAEWWAKEESEKMKETYKENKQYPVVYSCRWWRLAGIQR